MLKKFTWAHGIIAALGLFMIFILSMIFIFTQNWQNAEMVSENYYADELAYQGIINAKNNADALSEKPSFHQNANGITITFPKERKIDESTVHFHLFRTNDAKLDVKKSLTVDSNNSIVIPSKVIFPGSYTLKINWEENNTPYQIDYDVLWK